LCAVAYLTTEVGLGGHSDDARAVRDEAESGLEVGSLLALCALAALLTAGANRPNADDAYFVTVAIAVNEVPSAAAERFDTMQRTGLPPVVQVTHSPQVYEVFGGLLSSVSGVSVRVLYWVVLPPLWAVFATLSTWVGLRCLVPRRDALLGCTIFVFLLV